MRKTLTVTLILVSSVVTADDTKPKSEIDYSKLPGHIDEPVGSVNSIEFPLEDGPECRKYRIAVPENRAAESSRTIRLYFYRFKAQKPSGHAPVFFLPGGPGGFYNDNWAEGLNKEPGGGSNLEAWNYSQDRDVVLVNQRGASLPDQTYRFMFFLSLGLSLEKPFDYEEYQERLRESVQPAFKQWGRAGVDLAGYDIMNMIEDINDIRKKLGYEKITLRGTSFGSQWSMAYMRKYPQHVDRAVLGGTEPLDHGWDSSQGVWNVMGRVGKHLERTKKESECDFPDIPLTDAIKAIIKRLEKEPVVVEARSSRSAKPKSIPIGVQDFQRTLRGGIGGHRERRESFTYLPKFVYEVYNGQYDYLASRVLKQRPATNGMPLQYLLVDNSLGISEQREQKLENEPGRRWIGELNADYKATRDVTPTPVIGDEFRKLKTNIPMLLVHGDFDLSTPIENARELMEDAPNAHLILIKGGTHGAVDQIERHDSKFTGLVQKFLNADFDSGKQTVQSLNLPSELELPDLELKDMSGKTLFETLIK